jgi:hypothetical protein
MTMSEQRDFSHTLTPYASLLNAAHLLAEEANHRLHELAARYPEAFSAQERSPEGAAFARECASGSTPTG